MRLKTLQVGALPILVTMVFLLAVKSETSVHESGKHLEPATISPAGDPIPLSPMSDAKIEVLKRSRQLVLYSGSRIMKTYRIGLGFSPEGPKIRQGDGRTPEGSYYVCSKNSKSQFFLSLGLSYPNEGDAIRGLKEGLIDRNQYQQIASAIQHGGVPLWNTALGGEIFIHGNGSKSDWTWGCVALENQDIQELFNTVPKGTPVTIKP